MCEVGRRLWQKNLVAATEGNLSVRLSAQRLLCTPSGVSKGHLRPDQLVVIDLHGRPQGAGQPSSEILLHLAVYRHRADCQAVVHAHPPVSTGFALAAETIPDSLTPEATAVLGSVATVPFAMPGTTQVAEAIEPLLADHKAFLLSHHGTVTLGLDLLDALYRTETLERTAHIYLVSRMLGGPAPMPDTAIQQLSVQYLNGKL